MASSNPGNEHGLAGWGEVNAKFWGDNRAPGAVRSRR